MCCGRPCGFDGRRLVRGGYGTGEGRLVTWGKARARKRASGHPRQGTCTRSRRGYRGTGSLLLVLGGRRTARPGVGRLRPSFPKYPRRHVRIVNIVMTSPYPYRFVPVSHGTYSGYLYGTSLHRSTRSSATAGRGTCWGRSPLHPALLWSARRSDPPLSTAFHRL